MDSNLKKSKDSLVNTPKTEEENELKLLPSNEIQAKLLGSLKENRMDGAISIIIAALELGEFEISDQGTIMDPGIWTVKQGKIKSQKNNAQTLQCYLQSRRYQRTDERRKVTIQA